MIDISKIKGRSAMTLLKTYSGTNPYLIKLRDNPPSSLTVNQTTYINDYYNREPVPINKVLRVTPYIGDELKKQDELPFTPEKIFVEYILADMVKSYHVLGKTKQNQVHSKMYWLPKTQVIDDPYLDIKDVEVDFEKYKSLDTLNRIPYEHQKTGIKFLLGRNGCILADDMGLGKTYVSTIAALESGAKKVLIVCPSSLKINWEREIKCFCDDVAIVNGKTWADARFVIVNYDILKNFHTIKEKKTGKTEDGEVIINDDIVKSNFDLIIVDEAHYLKNPDSIRAKVMLDVCLKFGEKKVWLLSGTPVANRPMDYYNLLKIIRSNLANNWQFYATRYCAAQHFNKVLKNGKTKQIWITNGASNLDELASKTRNILLRRTKEEVLDMPDKTIIPVYNELSASGCKTYDNLWEEYLKKRKEEGKKVNLDRDLVELILLRKHIATEAIPNSIELAENAIEQGHKVIIFTTFTEELNSFKEHFGDICVTHNGPMSNTSKQLSVDRFQKDDKVKIFVGNVISAGVGITLTAADIVIFNSFDWVPGINRQAEDRAYRIGQKNNVMVYYQLFQKTISMRVWFTVKNKEKIINSIIKTETEQEENIFDILDEILANNENY